MSAYSSFEGLILQFLNVLHLAVTTTCDKSDGSLAGSDVIAPSLCGRLTY